MKHANVQAGGLVDQLRRLLPVVDAMHVGPLPLNFTSLTIHPVVHELVEIFFNVILRRGTHGGIHRDVGHHPGQLRELNDAMNLCEAHPMIQVEFKVAVVCDVILLVHEIGDELEVLSCSGAGVVTGDGDLGNRQHLHLDVETFVGEGIVVVCFVEFRRVLQITLNDVSNPVVVAE